jgi:aminoglycoside 3-N-acetyltransferase
MTNKNTEHSVVEKSSEPITKQRLIDDFHKLGLQAGDTVMVHSSLSKIGWVIGAEITVINALLETVTSEGTVVMPAHSSTNTNPAVWQNPPVPESWWETIRQEMPPYDPQITPTRGIGKIPEVFRTYPNVLRSAHPQQSFAAWGKHAAFITKGHDLTPSFGDHSPLARLCDLEGKILLLGVDHGNNTTLHYAEVKADLPNAPRESQGAAMMTDHGRDWVSFEEVGYDDEDFFQVGTAYEQSIGYVPGKVGMAPSKLVDAKSLVEYAINWLKENRKYPPKD